MNSRLEGFIVQAKSATWLAGGVKSPPSRVGSVDLHYTDGTLEYLDCYFGSTDFLGQEVVHDQQQPIWAMNYYGRILEPTRFDGARAAQVIRAGRGGMYQAGRFLGDHRETTADGVFFNTSSGSLTAFQGCEWIELEGLRVYELVYHGGLVKA